MFCEGNNLGTGTRQATWLFETCVHQSLKDWRGSWPAWWKYSVIGGCLPQLFLQEVGRATYRVKTALLCVCEPFASSLMLVGVCVSVAVWSSWGMDFVLALILLPWLKLLLWSILKSLKPLESATASINQEPLCAPHSAGAYHKHSVIEDELEGTAFSSLIDK